MWPTIWLSLTGAVFTPVDGQPHLLVLAHACAADNLDTATQGVSNSHTEDTVKPSFPAWDYLPVYHMHRNYLK